MATLHLSRAARKRPSKSHDPILRPGSSFCRCSGCGEYFKSARAFDAHREGEYRPTVNRACAPTSRMSERGLQLDPNGVWCFPKRAFHGRRLEVAA